MADYKEIRIQNPTLPKDIVEVEIEDITEESEQETLDYNTDTSEQRRSYAPVEKTRKGATVTFAEDENDDDDSAQDDQETPAPVKAQAPKKRKNTANARIRELNSQKNELYHLLEMERLEKEELLQRLTEGNKTSKESLKSTLESQIVLLKKQLKDAMQEGDVESTVDLQEKMMDTKRTLDNLSSDLRTSSTEEAPSPRRVPTKESVAPVVDNQKAFDWIAEHPEFDTDPVFYRAAIDLNNKLIREGHDPTQDAFYEEINARLQVKFPEVFGIEEENEVEYSEETSSSRRTDVKKPVRQTVSGASRTPSSTHVVPSSRKSNTVKLSPEEIAQAEQWGWSIERMARRKHHIAKHRREDGYVPIIISPTDKR